MQPLLKGLGFLNLVCLFTISLVNYAQAEDRSLIAIPLQVLLEVTGRNNHAALMQFGDKNIAHINQQGHGHQTYAAQVGNENSAEITQAGSNNKVIHAQFGIQNHANIAQMGDNNTVILNQMGSQQISIMQYTDNAAVIVTQY